MFHGGGGHRSRSQFNKFACSMEENSMISTPKSCSNATGAVVSDEQPKEEFLDDAEY